MAIRKERNRRLTDDPRLEPEAAVRKRKSFSQIRREPGIPRSTARREIMNHREESTRTFYGRRFSPCTHRDGCGSHGLCGRPDCTRNCASCGLRCRGGSCPGFEGEACPRLAAAPYVCNGCPDGGRCRLRKFHHLHRVAHKRYRDTPVTARQGIYATRGEPRAINEVPVPALNRGRSVHHAMVSSPEDGSVRTRVFYTRPHRATDRAQAERNHEYVRRVVLKGESFDSLAQEHVNTMMSHVNSHVRASLVKGVAPCRTPYERFAFECGGQIAGRLGIVPVPLEEATLRPELLEMNRSPPDKVRPKAIDGGRPVSTPEGESRASPWNRHAHFPMQKCTEYANLHLESLQFHANPYRQIP